MALVNKYYKNNDYYLIELNRLNSTNGSNKAFPKEHMVIKRVKMSPEVVV